ncbi:AsmA family protein [Tardiphaga alba]|uniref:AsmA family protein n=1 Tax=Tardiphaga alba TaxID=340268 RepID=UPI002E1E273A
MLALLGLNGVVAAGDAPLTFEGNATGAWRASMQVKAKLSGTELDADVQGSTELLAAVPKASLALAIRAANATPLFGLKPADAMAQRISLSSRVSLNGEKLSFEDIDSTLDGSRMRGRLALTLGAEKSIDGQLGADRIDLASAFGFAIGARGQDASEPLSRDLLQGWRGQLAFQALSAVLPGGSEIRPFNTIVRNNGNALTLDAITGKIGGGDVTADIDLTRSATTGYTLGVRAQLAGVDGAALRYQSLAMPAGKTSFRMTLSSQGRSASALAGAISGDGLVTIDQLRIAGLDPRVFDTAIRASDTGQATDDAKLRQIVETELGRGAFAVASAQIPFSIKDSRLRVGATSLEADGAQAIVSGGYDIVAEQADIRANLSRPAGGASSARPEIQLFLVGPPDRLDRTVDVGALSSWLAVRAIDRETRRLDQLERGPAASIIVAPPADSAPSINDLTTSSAPNLQDVPLPGKDPRRAPVKPVAPRPPSAAAAPSVSSQQMAPLPAPIDVKPAPGAARAPRPRPSGPLVLTPPTAAPSARPTF